MIDYDQIIHCLDHIIAECENRTDAQEAIKQIHHTAKHALKLISLPEPKYKVGQEVWMLSDEYKPVSFIIDDIDEGSEEKYLGEYGDQVGWWEEERLYAAKEPLIEDQVGYWMKLLEDERNSKISWRGILAVGAECQHESDGNQYISGQTNGLVEYLKQKCLKCGEFYR